MQEEEKHKSSISFEKIGDLAKTIPTLLELDIFQKIVAKIEKKKQ